MQIRRVRGEITGASHYLKLNYNHSFTILRKIFFKSNWKMNTNKLPLQDNRRKEQERNFVV